MSHDDQAIVQRFATFVMWKRGDERAPHKPLLLLIALARIQRGEPRLIPYRDPGVGLDIETKLTELLRDYGPPRKACHPNDPFWRLRKDGLWEIPEEQILIAARSSDTSGNMPVSFLRRYHAQGGLPEDLDAALRGRPDLVHRIAAMLLEEHFPPSLHDEILDAVGMPWVVVDTAQRRRRDPGFRDAILRIYEYRCAICGYAGRLGQNTLNLEAAHVKWHGHGGPDTLDNGVAMCTFHHRAFDRGAIGMTRDHRIQISQHVNGCENTESWLIRWNGEPLRRPQTGQPAPALDYITWHQREVFRAPARM